jgi:hypothetical protein
MVDSMIKGLRLTIRSKVIDWALVAAITAVVCQGADDTGSTIIDWTARTTGQQACVQPSSSPTTAKLRLQNTNPILYSYYLDVRSYALPGDDGKFLIGLATTKGAAQSASCESFNSAVDRIWTQSQLFPRDRESIPLAQTLDELSRFSRDIDLVTDGPPQGCNLANPTAAQAELEYLPVYKRAQILLDNGAPPEITFSYQVDNKRWNQFRLVERARYSGRGTRASLTWKCGFDDILTLSVGTALTNVPYRTYINQKVPTSGGTQDQLVVNGNGSRSPVGIGLLNYKLWNSAREPQFGLSLSTGPAFKLGGAPEVSSFGWFAGVSVSIWHGLFLTPGVHVSQFADFPPGFSDRSPIPANFGTLNPITRWTTRFAIGITFQTNSLTKADKSTPTSSNSADGSAGTGKK